MRWLYNFSRIKYFIVFLSVISITNHVNAQSTLLQKGKDNFTFFTLQKTYTDIAKINALTPKTYRNNPDFGKCLNDSAQWYEQIDKRTLKSRTYVAGDNRVIFEYGYDNLNYVDEKGWMRAVDTKLKPSVNGWSAQQQETPVYLYPDASTALSVGHNEEMIFNKNVQFNGTNISTDDYTVGDNGMYIKNAITGIDKIIRFGRGRIESDYHINQPLKINGDLVVSEDIILPAGYTITENENYNKGGDRRGSLIVNGPDSKIVAEIQAPVCYDNSRNSIIGSYHIQKQTGGYKLEVDVPSSWLNNAACQYPVTIDPVITGRTSVWPIGNGVINSCYNSILVPPANGMDTGSIQVTIPAGVTITNFYVQGGFYTPVLAVEHGSSWFWTSCGDSLYTIPLQDADTSLHGYSYLNLIDFLSVATAFLCCFQPSCDSQTFRFTMAIVRNDSSRGGCDSTYLYYDPNNNDNHPFEAYIVGQTVTSNNSEWSITPLPLCGNDCDITLNVAANYGVPPYKVTHPWSTDTATFGDYTSSCTSSGNVKLALTVPNCPVAACTTPNLTIPPPKITDACGDTVIGLLPRTITLKTVPNVTATPDSQTICSGTNVNIALSSCDSPATTYLWMSSEGKDGTGTPINNVANNNTANNVTVTYTVIPSVSGCAGNPTVFPVTVTPFTISVIPATDSICNGNSVNLTTTSEATIYSWSPDTGISCTSCSSVTVSPTVTTTYFVNGSNGGACSAFDSAVVDVSYDPTLSVSNDTTILFGKSAQLSAKSNGSVTWSPATGLSTSNGDSTVATPSVTTTYKVTATQGACMVSTDVTVNVIIPCDEVKVPSAFTPNGNGVNDYLHILDFAQVQLQAFRIYNRWGQLVFETNNISDGWDGTYNGKPQPMGTYVYFAQVNCQGKVFSVKGDVTLLR
jgi:gliding motility-associated-like protein